MKEPGVGRREEYEMLLGKTIRVGVSSTVQKKKQGPESYMGSWERHLATLG